MGVSVLIPARNEAANIIGCLDSVRWASEVVVVDSNSTDRTVELAQSSGARVVDFRWNRRTPKKKSWALENVPWENEWVLILDADERITPELASEIQTEINAPRADGYFINRRFLFLGKWIRHCGYYPSWNLRLFRHRLGRYEHMYSGDTASGDNEVHEHVVLNGAAAYLKNDMLHYAYPDIYTWMEKHNRYSNWEAEIEVRGDQVTSSGAGIGLSLSKRRRLRTLSRRLPCRPALRFLYSYLLKLGFLDGIEGYMFCRLLATYEMLNVFKAAELRLRENAGTSRHVAETAASAAGGRRDDLEDGHRSAGNI
jgi:glycosyltransferase involved in cell wall biosynthesis